MIFSIYVSLDKGNKSKNKQMGLDYIKNPLHSDRNCQQTKKVLQGIFSTEGLNPHLLPWQADSLLLGHQGSPFGILISHKKQNIPICDNTE